MIKNTVSSTAARLAAAALCVAAAGSLSAETINLTAAANAAGCLEYGYGPQHNTDVQNFIFAEQTTGKTNQRYLGQNNLAPNYIAVHFTNDYEPGNLLRVTRMLIGTWTKRSDRYISSCVLQGSNDGTGFTTGAGTVPGTEEAWHDGWTDITAFSATQWDGTSDFYYIDTGTFDNVNSYRYYRLRINGFGVLYPEFTQFRLYGEVV